MSEAPTSDPRALAAWLRENHMPGERKMTAITRLRRSRERVRVELAQIGEWPTADRRHLGPTGTLWGRYMNEIQRRGGEVCIEDQTHERYLLLVDRRRVDGVWLALLRVEGWRQYSKRYGARRATLAYLCGRDDAGLWAVRVAGTCRTVRDALEWLEPEEVQMRRIGAFRSRIHRQGDIYAIETQARFDAPSGPIGRPRVMPSGLQVATHLWDAETRILTHQPPDEERAHAPLYLPMPVRFVQQNAYGMGRGAQRGAAD